MAKMMLLHLLFRRKKMRLSKMCAEVKRVNANKENGKISLSLFEMRIVDIARKIDGYEK